MSDRKLIEVEQHGRTVTLYGKAAGDLEIFVEGIHGMAFGGTHVKLNLYTIVPFLSDDHKEHREVAARLVMPLHTLVAIAQFLSQRVEELKTAGIVQFADEQTEEAPKDQGEGSSPLSPSALTGPSVR